MASTSRTQKTLAAVVTAVLVVAGGYFITRSFAATNQLYLAPASGTVLNGNTIDVAIHEDSGTDTVNAVQANMSYDQTQLQYVSTSDAGSAFGVDAQTTGGSGSVQIARGVSGGSPAVTGDQLVATVTFKALVGGNVTSAITFANGSAVVRSTDNTNILVNSAGASYTLGDATTPTPSATPTPTPTPTPTATPTPSGTPAPASASMYITPASGNVSDGSTLSFGVYENSGSTGVNAVQANYSYNPAQWAFVSIDGSNSAFGVQAQSSGSAGSIQIARGVSGGSPPVTGAQLVATVTLQATGNGAAALNPAAGSAVVSASTNSDILNSNQTSGGTFQLAAGGGTPTPTPPPTPTPTPSPAPVSVTGSGTVPVSGNIDVNTPTLADTGGSGVTCSLDGKSVPCNNINTTSLPDGLHTVTASVNTASGTSSVAQKIDVNNKHTPFTPFGAMLSSIAPATPYAIVAAAVLALGYLGFVYYRRMQGPKA